MVNYQLPEVLYRKNPESMKMRCSDGVFTFYYDINVAEAERATVAAIGSSDRGRQLITTEKLLIVFVRQGAHW